MQEQLAKIQQDMRDQMLESQKNMMSQLTQLLTGGLKKGKSSIVNLGDDNENPIYPPGSNPGDNPTNPVVPDLDDMAEMEKTRVKLPKQLEDRCRWLEEKFRAMENADYHCGINANDLNLVLDLVLPPKFKIPEFGKYNRTSCPEAHITMFCRKMTGYVNIDQLLIYSFQDSLIGSAAKWYNQLSLTKINSWKDLAQNIEKKQNKSFRQYALRWREVAIQVQLHLLEKETPMLFINTLKATFINHMLGSATMSFSDIVMSSEMIENAIRCGKIEAGENTKRSTQKNKENEVNNLSLYNKEYPKPITVGQPRAITTSYQGPSSLRSLNGTMRTPNARHKCDNREYGKENQENIVEVKTSLKWVLKQMIDKGLIIQDLEEIPKEMRSYCEFHAEEGHEIQACAEFKALVQSMMDNKELEFIEEVKGPEGMLGNLNIDAVSEEGAREENLSCIYLYILGNVLNNRTVEEVPVYFRANTESLDINDMSGTVINSEPPFEQDMCLEQP
ncbi:trans-resveratrol di-O-methyltransferase-like [Gossypium australe]|uniref:Trans-resveratrol di-O-methyltransferase-like n=1 Tax=Gossypium australe TaxID=47621 RepID=A0A5B6V6S5_9ROSI|nr:trans-resveratrol di-O-methyltransferase-like [Gossypium australe]